MSTLPTGFAQLTLAFAPLFSKRVFQSVQVLLFGAILAIGKRTVTSVLRVMGMDQQADFQTYHRALNRAVWSPLAASRILLRLLVRAFAPHGPLIFGLDDTIEPFEPISGSGTGFKFTAYEGRALLECVRQAVRIFSDTRAWRRLMANGMAKDYSWNASAAEYAKLYEAAKKAEKVKGKRKKAFRERAAAAGSGKTLPKGRV